jgi:hypothetical protein
MEAEREEAKEQIAELRDTRDTQEETVNSLGKLLGPLSSGYN